MAHETQKNWATLFEIFPKQEDISPSGDGTHKLYSGQWWRKNKLPKGRFVDTPDGLAIPVGGEISTASNASTRGALPLINASRSFHVEFEAKLSSTDPDHWPALWLMPIEHSGKQADEVAGDGPGFQRWVEIDVDEGGFSPGAHGGMINWEGRWPDYRRGRMYGPHASKTPLDRTKFHSFGYTYDAQRKRAQWWINKIPTAEYEVDQMPNHHYYVIVTAGSHRRKSPYNLIIRRILVLTEKTVN